MLDIGWTELLIIGALALIVVGPKDLPRMMRTAGQYVGKMRGMAREFQRSMNDAAREADLSDMKELKGLKSDINAMKSDFDKQVRGTSSVTPKPAVKKPVEGASGTAAVAGDKTADKTAAAADAAPSETKTSETSTETPKAAEPPKAAPAETGGADGSSPDPATAKG